MKICKKGGKLWNKEDEKLEKKSKEIWKASVLKHWKKKLEENFK